MYAKQNFAPAINATDGVFAVGVRNGERIRSPVRKLASSNPVMHATSRKILQSQQPAPDTSTAAPHNQAGDQIPFYFSSIAVPIEPDRLCHRSTTCKAPAVSFTRWHPSPLATLGQQVLQFAVEYESDSVKLFREPNFRVLRTAVSTTVLLPYQKGACVVTDFQDPANCWVHRNRQRPPPKPTSSTCTTNIFRSHPKTVFGRSRVAKELGELDSPCKSCLRNRHRG